MQGRVPASIGQRLLWLLEHFRGGEGALNCPVFLRLRGPLDVAALQEAVDALVARHEALRTTITGRGRRLVQIIHGPSPVEIRQEDLSGAADLEVALRRVTVQEMQENIDATARPLRVTLWRLGDLEHVLCLNMHHLVTDGWSCGLVVRDLAALFEQASGLESPLPSVDWQYSQFSEWQRALIDGDGMQTHQDYWRRQLTGARPPELPMQPGEARQNAPQADRATIDIDRNVVSSLGKLAMESHTTLFSVMLAIYYLALQRLTGETDLAVATLMANRSRPEVSQTVGFLANMVVLRTRFPGTGSFEDLLKATHTTVIEAFIHQGLPFQMLPADILRSDGRRADDVVFQMIANPNECQSMGPLDLEMIVPDAMGTRFEFELELYPKDGGFRGVLFFNQNRFEPAFARGLLGSYASLAEAIAGDHRSSLASLEP